MSSDTKTGGRATWAVGGGLLLGMGVGFFFLPKSVYVFTGCTLAGLGAGLLVTAILSSVQGNR